jgi:hypothetical protein
MGNWVFYAPLSELEQTNSWCLWGNDDGRLNLHSVFNAPKIYIKGAQTFFIASRNLRITLRALKSHQK